MTPCYMTTAQRLSRPLFVVLSSSFNAWTRLRSADKFNAWEERHKERIETLVKNRLPSGSGFDSGTQFDFDESRDEKLVFVTAFHHMDEFGSYDGWTEHKVIVTPSLSLGYVLKVTGRDRNGIKDYIAECFRTALDSIVTERELLDVDEENGNDVDEARRHLDERDAKEAFRFVCNGRLFNTEDEAKDEANRYHKETGVFLSIMPVKG